LWHRARAGTLIAASVTVMLALAGCGGSPGASAPSATATPRSGTTLTAEQFSQCMRTHGVPDFPDPNAQGGFSLPPGTNPNVPQFQAAQQACKAVAPAGPLNGHAISPKELGQALKFVHCMRTRGVAQFPDPTAQGTFNVDVHSSALNIDSPQFLKAMRSCRTLLPPGGGFGAGG
jgi:hypothetical protein